MKPPFPLVTLIIAFAIVLVLVAVLAVATHLTSSCAFGFGGFQCNDPVSGYGSTLLLAILLLPVLIAVCAIFIALRLWFWWRKTQRQVSGK
jgi:uncharacterized membrane protein